LDAFRQAYLGSESNPSDEINTKTCDVTLNNRGNQFATVLVNLGDLCEDWKILDNTVPLVRNDAIDSAFSAPIQVYS
jgi:hypothetical protein